MYIDLLSKESHLMVNKKLIRVIGLSNAAYLAAIVEIMSAVLKKQTYNEEGFWPVDREYVEQCTGLTAKEQRVCDEALNKLAIIYSDKTNKDLICVDLQKLLPVIVDDTKCTLQTISKATKIDKETKSRNKKEAQIENMCMHCDDKEPDENLRELYHAWVRSVYTKNYLTHAVIDIFIADINAFTEDPVIKADVLRYAVSTGYKTASWVLGAYKRDTISKGTLGIKQKVATSVDTTETF